MQCLLSNMNTAYMTSCTPVTNCLCFLQQIGIARLQCQICWDLGFESALHNEKEKAPPVRIPLQGEHVGICATNALAGDVGELCGSVRLCR